MARKKTTTTEAAPTAVEPQAPAPVVGAEAAPAQGRVTLRKKDFIDLTIARAGIRKADARTAVEATLVTLAQALAAGQDVVLPPLGKLRVIREKPSKQGRTLMVRLVLDEAATEDAQPLAATSNQG